MCIYSLCHSPLVLNAFQWVTLSSALVFPKLFTVLHRDSREGSRRQAPSMDPSPLPMLSPNGANSGNSKALLPCLNISTHRSTDTHPQQQQVYCRSSSSNTPWECRICCLPSPWIFIQRFLSHIVEQLLFTYLASKADVVIFTAEKPNKVVERDVGGEV